jgi:hypothetical protein
MWLFRGPKAIWNGRDTRGHYAKLERVADDYPDTPVCHHACCKGKRPHPAGLPVMRAKKKPAAKKKRAPAKKPGKFSPGLGPRRPTTPADAARQLRTDYAGYLHAEYLAAESATNGYMVNRAGKKKGYTGSDFFKVGRRPSLSSYASPELAEYMRGRRVLSLTAYRDRLRRAA